MKKAGKPNFGQLMAALKWARAKIAKDKAMVDEMFKPIAPLDQPTHAVVTLKGMEATAPVPAPGQQVTIQPQTTLDRAVQRLREAAKKAE